jgi:resolvase-like protein
MLLSNKPEALLPKATRALVSDSGINSSWRDRCLESTAQSTGMRTAVYTRVSGNDQNCEMQLRELRAYAQARGRGIVKGFKDEGWNGIRPDRPALRCNLGSAPLNVEYCLADRTACSGGLVQSSGPLRPPYPGEVVCCTGMGKGELAQL